MRVNREQEGKQHAAQCQWIGDLGFVTEHIGNLQSLGLGEQSDVHGEAEAVLEQSFLFKKKKILKDYYPEGHDCLQVHWEGGRRK